jgi:hypothetical protein
MSTAGFPFEEPVIDIGKSLKKDLTHSALTLRMSAVHALNRSVR